MGPGPSNPYPEVAEAFARPLLGHLDPDFLVLLDETCDRLRRVFRTENELTLPISGTGSAGMEAAFVNFVDPGDVVVIGVNGVFGERMCDVAARCGADVIRVEAEWGTSIDPQRLLDAHSSPKIIAVVHAETSTPAGRAMPSAAGCCTRGSRSWASGCLPKRVIVSPSSRPRGCPTASATKRRCAARCSIATASRSAGDSAPMPAGSGASAAW